MPLNLTVLIAWLCLQSIYLVAHASKLSLQRILPLKEHAHISDCFIYIPVSGKGKEFFAFATWAPEGR